jgi:hypothetical protein
LHRRRTLTVSSISDRRLTEKETDTARKSAAFEELELQMLARARWRQSVRGHPMIRTHMAAIAMIALVGFGSQAHGQARCPELMRLRSAAAEAAKQTRGGLAPTRCESYNRVAMAWDAVARYAKDNRYSCDISAASLNDYEKYHHEAMMARDNVCAGRPARPFPPEIIRR